MVVGIAAEVVVDRAINLLEESCHDPLSTPHDQTQRGSYVGQGAAVELVGIAIVSLIEEN